MVMLPIGRVLLLLLFLNTCLSFSPDIRIIFAERRIDLTSSIVRQYWTLKVENIGASHTSEIILAFPPTQAEHIALVHASIIEGTGKRKIYVPLAVNPTESSETPNDAKLFSIFLNNPLKISERAMLEVLVILTRYLQPFPAEITQSESQLVYYHDSAILLSPYHVKEQIAYIRTSNTRVESYTTVDPTNHAGAELRYGRYDDSTPYSYSPIFVHFENNYPFAIIEELIRVVEISHWGNLQVKENYKLVHAGARHKGIFSRLEYQSRQSPNSVSSFKQLLARLPPRVHSVYYQDEIGNISSSHLRVDSQKSELEVEPRYPLFGGWKTSFIIGYSLPLQDFLFVSPDNRRYLDLSFGSPFLETVVDDLTIKVVLPEGSKEPSAVVPFHVEQHLETSYTYLDVVGRPTVVLKKKNIVPEHNVPFQVYYRFNPVLMLGEPLMLAFVFFLFFIACISYVRIDLSIRKV